MTNTRDELIWMAGFFDGEGTVGIAKSKRTGRVGKFAMTVHIAVSQKHPEPLQRFKRRFGGHLYEYKLNDVRYWRWCVGASTATGILQQLLPYLFVKREITELILRFHEQLTRWNKEFGRRGYPQEVLIAREAFYLQARALNARNRANTREPKYEGPRTQTTVN